MPHDLVVFLAIAAAIALGMGILVRRARRGAELPTKAEQPKLPESRAAIEAAKPTEPAVTREETALRAGLEKTRSGFIAKIGSLLQGKKIDPQLLGQLEEVLLTADIGVRTSQKIFDSLKMDLSRDELSDADALWKRIHDLSIAILDTGAPPIALDRAKPLVILAIGVNGVGKTTTLGKLAAQYTGMGKKVLLAAGDTFRAAATEQLEIWGQRVGCPVVRGKEGGDPSSVVFDGVKRAQAEGFDILLADTAGRLHTKTELMEELQKVRRVVGKAMEGAPHETFLVIDATTGQNAIAQAQLFQQAMAISGIVLTKLDGTAKGGVILGICDELRVPVRYIGVGEKVEDLRAFDPTAFARALFGHGSESKAA